jgi:hypothetical protein
MTPRIRMMTAAPPIAKPRPRSALNALSVLAPWPVTLNTPSPARKIWAPPASRKASSSHR